MKVKGHQTGVAIVPPEEAFDENLPGQINLTFAEADQLCQRLEAILVQREVDKRNV